MVKRLADFEATEGGYLDPGGCWCGNAERLIHVGLLGFCGCYDPESNLEYVLAQLEAIEEYRWKVWPGKDSLPAATYFFWYWCEKEDLTEHGGTVPGWLTGKGEELLGLLREWKHGSGTNLEGAAAVLSPEAGDVGAVRGDQGGVSVGGEDGGGGVAGGK